MNQPSPAAPPRLALIACSVFESEVGLHAAGADHIVARRWLEIALHDQPDNLRTKLQEAVDELDELRDLDAVVLLYGLCGRGSAGLLARSKPLIIPRVHDCIAIFLGSRERFTEAQTGTNYFYSPGWNRARRVPGPDREAWLRSQWKDKYEPEDLEFLLETERETWRHYRTATFVDLGTEEASREAAYAKSCADALGWQFEHLRGNPELMHDLIWGRWDDHRFQIVPPGKKLHHMVADRIFRIGNDP